MIPKDLLDEIATWARHARTGSLEITFQDGSVKWIERRERVSPAPVMADETSPCCDAALINPTDFGAKGACARCGRIWSVWRIRRMKQQIES